MYEKNMFYFTKICWGPPGFELKGSKILKKWKIWGEKRFFVFIKKVKYF